MPGSHEETNLNEIQTSRTSSSMQMSNIFIFCNLELLTSVPQPIIAPIMDSKAEHKMEKVGTFQTHSLNHWVMLSWLSW